MSKERSWTPGHTEFICYLKIVVFYKISALHWDRAYSKGEIEIMVSGIEQKDGKSQEEAGDNGEPRIKSLSVTVV